MGNYVIQTEIEDKITQARLIELTDDNDVEIVDTVKMNKAITDAEGEADAYLAKQYSVPITSPPAIVKAMCLDIVIYNLYARREGATEDVKDRHKNALKFFDKASRNEIALGINTLPVDSPNEGGPKSSKTNDDRIFTEDTMKNF